MASCDPSSSTSTPPDPSSAETKIYTDGLGRNVSVAIPALRIVSLSPSNTELLFAVGAGPQIVGRDDHSDFPARVEAIRSLGSSGGKLNTEALVALEPDLILTAEIQSAEQVSALEDLELRVFLLSNPKTFAELFRNVRLVGQLCGHETEASTLTASLEKRVNAVAERLRGVTLRPRVFYELDATDVRHPWTVGPGSFMHTLITLAGGENFGASLTQDYPRVSAETIIRRDTDIIVIRDAVFGVTVESVRRRAGWEALSAVKTGRIYPFDDNLASRPGPRLVEGLETLARLLHPDRFP
jgi:iron complex transport system substrate-binding protein